MRTHPVVVPALTLIAVLTSALPCTTFAEALAQREAAATAAPNPEARKQASTHFHRGVALFEEGAFRAALVEFERAYEIAPDYRLLYNIGHAHAELQDYLRATQSYERYLAEGGDAVPAETRREVESSLLALAERIGKLSIHVNIEAAEVFVDDQRIGVAPLPATITVNVGRHRIYARTEDGAVGEKLLDVAGGDLVEVNLELLSSQPARAPQLALSPMPPSPARSPLRWGAIASWSLTAPAVATAIATGLIARSKVDDGDAALAVKPATAASKDRVSELQDKAHTLAITSDVMTGVSVALAVTGLVLWLRGDDKPHDTEPKAVSFGVGFGTAHVVGKF